jgi:hypothetical protein
MVVPLEKLSFFVPDLVILKPDYVRCVLYVRDYLVDGLSEVEIEGVEVSRVYAFSNHLDGRAFPVVAESTQRLRSLHERPSNNSTAYLTN